MKKTCILVVLDGWGIGRNDESNPIYVVNPKNLARLKERFPMTSLQASGISVGLPWGEVGNSEVGHLTLGAGKVLYQYYPKITMAVRDGTFFENLAFKAAFAHARERGSSVQLVGLISKGNVHASLEHIQALLLMAQREGVARVNLHLFSDGKDSPPRTLETFLAELPKERLATLTGRYYAMDRNKHWELTEMAYENLTGRGGTCVHEFLPTIEATYARGLTEEYLPPLRINDEKIIKDGDALIFFNYREDSIRQLAESFILPTFSAFPIQRFSDLYVVTMTHYKDEFVTPVAFTADVVEDTLGRTLERLGKTQLRLAETYKYAHVTFFFNGYREPPYTNEYRILIPSISSPRIEEHPEMMAAPITDRLIDAVQSRAFDFILVNYSNSDTIAHTANYAAGLRAVEAIDNEISKILKVALHPDVALLITSDHGNVEEMINPATALPESQHDPNPVPLYLIAPEFEGKKFVNWKSVEVETLGSLADVAPTILELLGLPQPAAMTGRSLLDGLF